MKRFIFVSMLLAGMGFSFLIAAEMMPPMMSPMMGDRFNQDGDITLTDAQKAELAKFNEIKQKEQQALSMQLQTKRSAIDEQYNKLREEENELNAKMQQIKKDMDEKYESILTAEQRAQKQKAREAREQAMRKGMFSVDLMRLNQEQREANKEYYEKKSEEYYKLQDQVKISYAAIEEANKKMQDIQQEVKKKTDSLYKLQPKQEAKPGDMKNDPALMGTPAMAPVK